MKHRVTLVIDQSGDHPDERIGDAEALAEYLRDEVVWLAERNDAEPQVGFGTLLFAIDPDSIEAEEVAE